MADTAADKKISADFKFAVSKARDAAIKEIMRRGYNIGMTVRVSGKGRMSGVYRITGLEWGSADAPFIAFTGQKRFSDGSFGKHHHSLGTIEYLSLI